MYTVLYYMVKRQNSLLKLFLTICSAAETGLLVLTLRVAGDYLTHLMSPLLSYLAPVIAFNDQF